MRYRYQSGDQIYDISIERHGPGFRAQVDGKTYDLEVLGEQPGQIYLNFAGRPITVDWASEGGRRWFSLEGCTYILEKPGPGSKRRGAEHGAEESLRAPMPAQVRSVLVAEGDPVEKGDDILLLEAMKMEIRLRAPRQGRLKRLLVAEGDSVDRDQVLAEIES